MPQPKPVGEAETYVIDGLEDDRTYQFTISVCDEVPNCTPWSSPLTAQTQDVTPPGRVTNLGFEFSQGDYVMNWTAPGDDGFVGTVSGLDLRYTLNCEEPWSSMTSVQLEPGAWTPHPAGTPVPIHYRFSMPEGVLHCFILKTCDEAGNWSEPSNCACSPVPTVSFVNQVRDLTPPLESVLVRAPRDW